MPTFNILPYGTGTFAATNSITSVKENFKALLRDPVLQIIKM